MQLEQGGPGIHARLMEQSKMVARHKQGGRVSWRHTAIHLTMQLARLNVRLMNKANNRRATIRQTKQESRIRYPLAWSWQVIYSLTYSLNQYVYTQLTRAQKKK